MNDPTAILTSLATLPASLRQLIELELRAGNSVVEITTAVPAPPGGLCVRLAKHVSTHPRSDSRDIRFYERTSPNYAGQFSDAQFKYFVLEPPGDPAVELDMNAIRAELDARERAANANRFRSGLWFEADTKQRAANADRFKSGLW